MSKWIIRWNAGYGDDHCVIEAGSYEEAKQIAYEEWHQEAENNADYDAVEYTDELAQDLGL